MGLRGKVQGWAWAPAAAQLFCVEPTALQQQSLHLDNHCTWTHRGCLQVTSLQEQAPEVSDDAGCRYAAAYSWSSGYMTPQSC
jgi:hypothetical protein